ncbi:hypothetical protein SAMN04488511_102228 [Pedobacter suwonensis]|uniref:Uncharacterized protein n=1 Tax=Pedobacter suwonensis TaxID=332999 RepID=A0A1I0SNH4_9SPHI|nr:hypothetical protein [Pedobacter suwonensis]SFA41048.1 hypothetical protein SAMN04488511_102228 [Pedobacter suwonensis]
MDSKPWRFTKMHHPNKTERVCSYRHCENTYEGRSDKVFCSDQCRNHARRDQLKTEKWNAPAFYLKITEIVKTNHKILKLQYDEKGENKVISNFLLRDCGFNFEFHTRILHTSKGIYRFCFDYGWLELENGKILIVKNEKMVEI